MSGRTSWAVPFSEIDQACATSEDAFGPFNGELAVDTGERLDVERLRAAAAGASRMHFLCGVRRRRAGPWGCRDAWVPDREAWMDEVVVQSEPAAPQDRDDFLEQFVPASRAPAFRLLLARHEDGDQLTLSASHIATDGLGALCLLRTIAAEYAGRPVEPSAVGYREARRFLATLTDRTPEARRREWEVACRLAQETWPGATTHVAASAEGLGLGRGLHHHRIAWAPEPRRHRDAPTVNDVLAVALLRAIEEHNIRRGVACGRMTILVPLNLRPPSWAGRPMGNFSIVSLLVSQPRQRVEPRRFLASIAEQSRMLRADRAAAGQLSILRLSAILPRFVQDVATRVVYASDQMPTAILSNLGRIDDVPFATTGEVRAVWASPPCRSPCALGVGVVFHAGYLHFSFRFSRRVLSRADVEILASRMGVEATELRRQR